MTWFDFLSKQNIISKHIQNGGKGMNLSNSGFFKNIKNAAGFRIAAPPWFLRLMYTNHVSALYMELREKEISLEG